MIISLNTNKVNKEVKFREYQTFKDTCINSKLSFWGEFNPQSQSLTGAHK